MLAVVRNFTIGMADDGSPAAFFDAYYDEGVSIPVTLSGAAAIVSFLRDAGHLSAPNVDGTPCLLDGADPPAFVRVATV